MLRVIGLGYLLNIVDSQDGKILSEWGELEFLDKKEALGLWIGEEITWNASKIIS